MNSQKIYPTKTELKRKLLKTHKKCAICNHKLRVSRNLVNGQVKYSNEAILVNETLICYQCHRIKCKRKDATKAPIFTQYRKKIDSLTGVFSLCRRIRLIYNQFYYFKIKGGIPNGKLPVAWLR